MMTWCSQWFDCRSLSQILCLNIRLYSLTCEDFGIWHYYYYEGLKDASECESSVNNIHIEGRHRWIRSVLRRNSNCSGKSSMCIFFSAVTLIIVSVGMPRKNVILMTMPTIACHGLNRTHYRIYVMGGGRDPETCPHRMHRYYSALYAPEIIHSARSSYFPHIT